MIITAPSEPDIELPLNSGPFWPEIEPADIRDAQRIDNTVTPERLRHALIEAIATTNGALLEWRQAQETLGNATLAAIPAEEIDSESILLHRYRRAVGCLAKALLLERYRDADATGKADRKADLLTDPIDDCRRDHHHALAAIAGRPRTTVELI